MLIFKKRDLSRKEVVFLKTVQGPETAVKKTNIVDILCKGERGIRTLLKCKSRKKEALKRERSTMPQKLNIS